MTKQVEKKVFVGTPFPDGMMDAQKSFAESNKLVENNDTFKKFLEDNNLENKRSAMIVFGPENFMYWYGVITDGSLEVPKGLIKYELPKAEVAEEIIENSNPVFFDLPLNSVLPEFIKKITESGVQVYENIGDSPVPYIVEDMDLDNKKLTQMLYVKASE
ncbi:hypothetical protein [Lactobacillus sp. LL6]|uniref:hypothetical protein n=1 Tax=Lactobacillus sp. LL6 TaxID=2596827 RepID=UPI0011872599|nr:hypothetical protein [Lactobacillus sp. LL6]TSO25978.1 hypothetical protein FOD82_02605 [Lactobacillus sp. LL6]